MAVGGGGYGYDGYGGGGSGYVASTTTTVSSSQLVVRVGGPRELSSVETSEGQTILTAQAGGEADYYVDSYNGGGAGYSGGGGGADDSYGGDGGDNGADGGDGFCGSTVCPGGSGSGLDISSVPISSFLLTPGRGGRQSDGLGGGGGGVMVDQAGPQSGEGAGQCYGGGEGGFDQPGPGLVLLEMKKKQ